MKQNYTEIAVILDQSGSMWSKVSDVIGSFNKFVKEQREVEGECRLTLVKFASRSDFVYTGKDIHEVEELTEKSYLPGGNTALYDAVAQTINSLGDRLRKMSENDRPGKVIVVIITDGEENHSRLFNSQQVREKITHQESVYNWKFIFLGEGIDAFTDGDALGIPQARILRFASHQYDIGTQCLNASVSSYRSSGDDQAFAANLGRDLTDPQ